MDEVIADENMNYDGITEGDIEGGESDGGHPCG